MPRSPANPKMRIFGAVLAVLAIYLIVVAITGWRVGSVGPRIAMVLIGSVLLAIAVLLLVTRTPGLRTIRADADGLHVELVGGRVETVPWASVGWVRLDTVGPIFGGRLLRFEYAPGSRRPSGLAAFENGGRVILGVPNRRTGDALRAQLPTVAGTRFRT